MDEPDQQSPAMLSITLLSENGERKAAAHHVIENKNAQTNTDDKN